MPKRLEILSELVPLAKLIALLIKPGSQETEGNVREVEEAAHVKGAQLQILKASNEGEIDAAFETLARVKAGASTLSVRGDADGTCGAFSIRGCTYCPIATTTF
jgi:hypothetical protein